MVGFAVAGALLLAVPALAQDQANPETASYTSFDPATATPDMFRWYLADTTTTDVTIAAHGTVSFSNPTSASKSHNVDFVGDQKPQCKLSMDTAASTAPIPAKPTPGQWSGTCVFDQPGTYRFVCDNPFHPNMTGTITVAAPPAATPTAPPPPAASPTPPPRPAARPAAATAVTVKHHQTGTRVKGSLGISRPGTRIEIVVLSRRATLGLSGKGRVRVGRGVVTAAAAGQKRFSVALDARARRVLRAHKTLPVLVRLKASAPTAVSVERVRAVRLRGAAGRS
jgi:plastocyanin